MHSLNGIPVIVKDPIPTYRAELRPAKAKRGPRRARRQRIKVFIGYQDLLPHGEIYKMNPPDFLRGMLPGGESLVMSRSTWNEVTKKVHLQNHEPGPQSGTRGGM